jgi:precorrin-2/cobalt-factor-2 C20-methyltransferase
LAGLLKEGKSVGLLAEGDPFFYGSFMHMWRRLATDFPVEVVPGVTGMSGCWTRAQTPITWGDDMLAVLPGTLGEKQLVERLRLTDAAVIMKVGRNLAKVRRAVEQAGLLSRAVYVERGTMEDERILPLADCGDGRGAYFGMVLIPGEGRRL